MEKKGKGKEKGKNSGERDVGERSFLRARFTRV